MPSKVNGTNIIVIQFQGSSWWICLPDGWERFTEIHYCCSPVHLQPAAYLEYLYQHAETSRIPKQGGPEGPPAGGFALWELWLYHGLSMLKCLQVWPSPASISFLLHRRLFCSQLLLLLDKQGKSSILNRDPDLPSCLCQDFIFRLSLERQRVTGMQRENLQHAVACSSRWAKPAPRSSFLGDLCKSCI